MELLGKQERYGEALNYYVQCEAALAEQELMETGKARTPDEHTRDIAEYLRTRQIQRGPVSVPDSATNTLLTRRAVLSGYLMPGSLSDTVYNGRVISGEQPPYANGDTMDRREAGKTMVGIGATLLTAPHLLGLMQVGMKLHDEEILSLLAAFIPICWRLYFDGKLSEVQRVLPGYISQLAILARQPSSEYQRKAASLASKAHQLASLLALQEQDYGAALIHVDQAIWGASRAEDANLQVAAFIRKGLVYRYINRYCKRCPELVLAAYREALEHSSSVSPLLRGRLYTGLAEAYSGLGPEQEDEAKRALELAYTIFPKKPQNDPHYSYTYFKLPKGFEVVMYLNLGQARRAWDILEKIDASIPQAAVPDRVELAIDQARASLLLGNMPQSCYYVEAAATSAVALSSALRYHEAHSIYEQMKIQWPGEHQVKALSEHFHR
jgi:tetratricopeptide (TPR) repeat protein